MIKISSIFLPVMVLGLVINANADTQSAMERLFGKKIAEQTAKPKQWGSSTTTQPQNNTKASAFDIKDVTVSGITIGDDYMNAVNYLKHHLTKDSISKSEGVSANRVKLESLKCERDYSNNNLSRFDGRTDEFDRCFGSYRTLLTDNRTVGSQFSVEVLISDSGLIKSINIDSRKKVADSESACKERVNAQTNEYVSTLGEPFQQLGSNWRTKRKKEWWSEGDKDYFIWDAACSRNGDMSEKITLVSEI